MIQGKYRAVLLSFLAVSSMGIIVLLWHYVQHNKHRDNVPASALCKASFNIINDNQRAEIGMYLYFFADNNGLIAYTERMNKDQSLTGKIAFSYTRSKNILLLRNIATSVDDNSIPIQQHGMLLAYLGVKDGENSAFILKSFEPDGTLISTNNVPLFVMTCDN
ncbi:hypothetical protein CIG19_12815 [Enterobacterales bacterium CwR94]|nr:hypothetical protein CIG19_12815 [Enterobacterales bacterium CwR94]